MDISKAVDNVLKSKAALTGNPLFGEGINLNDSQKIHLKHYVSEVAKRLQYCPENQILEEDVALTQLIKKMAQSVERRGRLPPDAANPPMEIEEALDVFCRLMEANPAVISSEESLDNIVLQYRKLQEDRYIQVDETMDPEDLRRHCDDICAIVDLTDCSQGWLDKNLPPIIKADVTTYSTSAVVLTNLENAGAIDAPRAVSVIAPKLESAYRIKAGGMEGNRFSPLHAPELRAVAFRLEASDLIAPQLKQGYEIWVADRENSSQPQNMELDSLQRAEAIQTLGYNLIAPNCEYIGEAIIANTRKVDLSSLVEVSKVVELLECTPLEGFKIPDTMIDEDKISIDDQNVRYAAARRNLSIDTDESGITTVASQEARGSHLTVIDPGASDFEP